jgi:hypothetical protein
LELAGNLKRDTGLPGFYGRLGIWMVGQAKHYKTVQSGTPDIRAIVGAVGLARGHAYSTPDDKYPELKILVCDPVFYLFFTSGTISRDGWRLLDTSGVVGMDGDMVAAFLADHGVAIKRTKFDSAAFKRWIKSHKPRRVKAG